MRKLELNFISIGDGWIEDVLQENPIYDEVDIITFGKTENLKYELFISYTAHTALFDDHPNPDEIHFTKRLTFIELHSITINDVSTTAAFDKWVIDKLELGSINNLLSL